MFGEGNSGVRSHMWGNHNSARRGLQVYRSHSSERKVIVWGRSQLCGESGVPTAHSSCFLARLLRAPSSHGLTDQHLSLLPSRSAPSTTDRKPLGPSPFQPPPPCAQTLPSQRCPQPLLSILCHPQAEGCCSPTHPALVACLPGPLHCLESDGVFAPTPQ